MARFLSRGEYRKTLPLFVECFGDDPEFCRVYYGEDGETTGDIYNCRVAVKEADGKIVSMAHIKPLCLAADRAVAADIRQYVAPRLKHELIATEQFSLLLCIGTAVARRGRGDMREVLAFAEAALRREGEQFCFLIAVDKRIYAPLGYEYHFPLSAGTRRFLYADEGLTEGTAKFF